MPVQYYWGDPRAAFAGAEQKLREMDAVNRLAGSGGSVLGALRRDRQGEDEENAEITSLKARLGLQTEEAQQEASPHALTETPLEMGGDQAPAPPASVGTAAAPGPWADAAAPAVAAEKPRGALGRLAGLATDYELDTGALKNAASGVGGYVADLGRRALIGTGLRPNYERRARLGELAQLGGRLGRARDERTIAGQLSPLATRSQDPGALLEKVAPSLGLHAGDVKLIPPATRGKLSLIDLVMAKQRGEPGAKEALESYVGAESSIKAAGRAPGAGGGEAAIKNRTQLALHLADLIDSGQVKRAKLIADQYAALGGPDLFAQLTGIGAKPEDANQEAPPTDTPAGDPDAQAAMEAYQRAMNGGGGGPPAGATMPAPRRPGRVVEGIRLE